MIDFTNINTIARKELRDNLRNRWFIIYTVAFAGLALALSALGQPGGAQAAGYNRTAASLVNLVLLFVPLIGLTLGAANIAGDRETGALAYLLAQPVTGAEVLIGKYLGMAGALFAALSLGFGLAGAAMIGRGQAGSYLLTVILACLLGLAMLSLGFLVSVTARKTVTALGGSLGLWLLLVFAGDLGVMGTAIVMQLPISTVFLVAAINPLQLFKFAAILSLQANLEILGPAGMYATQQFGSALLPLLLAGLVLWIVLPLAGALALFERQGRVAPRKSQGAI
jgi:Cu-processing system permease protein